MYFSGAEMLSYPRSIYLKKEKGIQTFPHSPHSSTHPAWEGSTTILLFNLSFSSWSKKETWQKAAGTPASSETQSGSFTALGKCVFRCYCTFILVQITSQKSQKTVRMQPIGKKTNDLWIFSNVKYQHFKSLNPQNKKNKKNKGSCHLEWFQTYLDWLYWFCWN